MTVQYSHNDVKFMLIHSATNENKHTASQNVHMDNGYKDKIMHTPENFPVS